jgi:uncharacterized membrane-anchored protein YhcB (DUF1043 family)
MDPTIIAAVTGILGVIIGAVVGGLFVRQATLRQIEVMQQQSRGDVNERLYNQSLLILKFFAENPELRPYFYDNKQLNRATNELEKSKVLAAAEMVGGFMELVALQIEDQPAEIQPRWKTYIEDAYNSSSVVREHLAACGNWYADDLLRLLPAKSGEPSQ